MQPTLELLLGTTELRLRLVAGAQPGDPALAAPLAWAHSTDLPDPVPWLTPGGLLLTDGSQFRAGVRSGAGGGDGADAAYVRRLVAGGIAALGVSTHIVHDAIPPGVLAACEDNRMPLLEVDARTPFMAIVKAVNDAAEQEQRARLEWSLRAQRAVARAALRPEGLSAVLRELESRLGCWVALYDATGRRVPIATSLRPPPDTLDLIRPDVRDSLRRGARGGARLAGEGNDVTLQTLGRPGELRGVLAVGTAAPLERVGHDLVASVIAVASIALDQSRALDEARGLLRSGLLQLMLAGSVDIARRSAEQIWGRLPEEPVRLCVIADSATGADDRAVAAELELLAERRHGRVFFGRDEGRLVTVTAARQTGAIRKLLRQLGRPAGCSAPVPWRELAVGLDEAQRAAQRARDDLPFVRFDDLVGQGLFGLIETSGGIPVARRLLQPLAELPPAQREILRHTARVWLRHNCVWHPAAQELGVHRHTLRNRITSLEKLLGLDLDTFAGRSELWAALELAGDDQGQ